MTTAPEQKKKKSFEIDASCLSTVSWSSKSWTSKIKIHSDTYSWNFQDNRDTLKVNNTNTNRMNTMKSEYFGVNNF